MTATAQATLTSADAWREVVQRQIAVVPAFDGQVWMASVDQKGDTITTKKRKVRQISATASSPIGAITKLLEILDAQPGDQEEFW